MKLYTDAGSLRSTAYALATKPSIWSTSPPIVPAAPAPVAAPRPSPVGFTQRQADAEAATPLPMILAAVAGVLLVGGVVVYKLKKKKR